MIGLYRQQRLFQERRVKPGDRFSYRSFEPTVNLVITTNVQVKDFEEVTFPGGKKRRLLRVEAQPEKIENVQLPTMLAWLGEDLTPVRTQVEVPGLGQMVLYRTTEAFAKSLPVEIGLHHQGLAHRSLNRPPHDFVTAATIRSWMVWTSASVRVRSGFWNWSAYAMLFIPVGVPGPA